MHLEVELMHVIVIFMLRALSEDFTFCDCVVDYLDSYFTAVSVHFTAF